MAMTLDENLAKAAYESIKTNSTLMDSKENKNKPETIMYRYAPRYQVNQSVYMKYLKDGGISPDVVDKLTHMEQAWNVASAKFASEKLKKMIPDMLGDKEFMKVASPKNAKVTVYTALKDGKRGVSINAYAENRNPRATSEADAITTTYGGCQIQHRITRTFPEETLSDISQQIEKELKGKF